MLLVAPVFVSLRRFAVYSEQELLVVLFVYITLLCLKPGSQLAPPGSPCAWAFVTVHHKMVALPLVLYLLLQHFQVGESSRLIQLPQSFLSMRGSLGGDTDAIVVHASSPSVTSPEASTTTGITSPPVPSRAPHAPTEDSPRELLGAPCIITRLENYEYSVCPYANVTQKDIQTGWLPFWGILGVYDSWEVDIAVSGHLGEGMNAADPASPEPAVGKSYLFQHYTDGTMCGSTPRSCAVSWRCAEAAAVLSVSEPSTCQYALVVASPLVCQSTTIQAVHEQGASWSASLSAGQPTSGQATLRDPPSPPLLAVPGGAQTPPAPLPPTRQCASDDAAHTTQGMAMQLALRLLRCALLHSAPPAKEDSAPAAHLRELARLLGSVQSARYGDKAPVDATAVTLLGMGSAITEDGGAQAVKAASRQAQLQADLAEAKRTIAAARAGHRQIPDVDKFMALARRVASAVHSEEGDAGESNRQRVACLVAASGNLQEGLLGESSGSVPALATDYACSGVLGLDVAALGRPDAVLAAAQGQLAAVLADMQAAHSTNT